MNTPPPESKHRVSVIAAGSTWEGSLETDGSLRVEGLASGEIQARHTVHITQGARVLGTIAAPIVVIAGSFQGRVDGAELVELLPTNWIGGELASRRLRVHEEAVVDCRVVMSDWPSGK